MTGSFSESMKSLLNFVGERVPLLSKSKNKILGVVSENDILFEEISTSSLFQERKIVFIENCNDKIMPDIQNIIDNLDNNKIIIFPNFQIIFVWNRSMTLTFGCIVLNVL